MIAGQLNADPPPLPAFFDDRPRCWLSEAVGRRHAGGGRTARENIADLLDAGTFVVWARCSPPRCTARTRGADRAHTGRRARRRHRSSRRRPCVAMSYDYTVLAGTQGARGHAKKDRLFELAERSGCRSCCSPRAAVGARRRRPSDRRRRSTAVRSRLFARQRPRPAASVSPLGYCFAGNAALLGCCDRDDRDRELEHRHGWPRDDRRRRPRRRRPGGGRSDRGPVRERRRRVAAGGRGDAVRLARRCLWPTSRADADRAAG